MKRHLRISDIIFITLFVVVSVILFEKCKYGFANIDESFYVSLPKRILQGDKLLLHEWNLAQFSGILLTPIVAILSRIRIPHMGILLMLRYVYVVIQGVTSVIIYIKLKKYSQLGAIFSSLLFYIYAPYSIMALSYNSMAILFFSLAMLQMISDGKRIIHIAAGMFFLFAMLSYPLLIILYVFYVLLILFFYWIRKPEDGFELKRFLDCFLGFFAGGFGIALVLCIGFPFDRLAKVINGILGDIEHADRSPMLLLWQYLHEILFFNQYNVIGYAIILLVTVLGYICRKNKIQRAILALVACIASTIHVVEIIRLTNYINLVTMPITALGLFFYVAFRDKQHKELFYGFWLSGLGFSVVAHIQSNQGIYAIANAGIIMQLASCIFVCRGLEAMSEIRFFLKQILQVAIIVFLVVQFLALLCCRYNQVFWERGRESQTEMIEEGPEAGILVTREKMELYNTYYSDIQDNMLNADQVLVLSEKTWLYLCGEYQNASFSAWLTEHPENVIGRLKYYYWINPEKIPTVIFVDNNHLETASFCRESGYELVKRCESGNLIYRKRTSGLNHE